MGVVGAGSITLFDQNDILYASLSATDALVPVDSNGTPKTSLTSSPLSTQIAVYKGGVLQTGWTFSRVQSNASSTINATTGAVSVTAISADIGYVDITAAKNGQSNLVKRYTITKVYQGTTGLQGPMGNPKALGVNTDLSKIVIAGFDDEGVFGALTGIVYVKSSRYILNATEYTVTQNGYGYILGDTSGIIKFARLRAESDGTSGSRRMAWKEFNSNIEIVADAVIGQFNVVGLSVIMAEMIPAQTTDQFINTSFMEILRNANDSNDTELKLMAMAMGADRVMQTIVAIEAFIKSLWVSRLESETFSVDGDGYPSEGFHLDGVAGVAKIANLIAKNADIFGSFRSDGFRTLPQVSGTTIPATSVAKTIYKYSEMSDLIPAQDSRQTLSGTIGGYSFTNATRRVNQRVMLDQTGPYTVTISAGQEHIMSRLTPVTLFGRNYFCEWHINYTGNVSGRLYLRTKPGQTVAQIASEWWYNTGTTENPVYPHQADMTLKTYHNSGSYSGSYALTPERPDATVFVYSNAIWGSVEATSNYHRVWTSQTFNGLLLTNGDSTYQVLDFQPDAYFLSSAYPFTVGAVNQDSVSIKKYASGTDFYNLFGSVAIGTNSAASGIVDINGMSYTVTRLRKDADKIVFFTGSLEIAVNKFISGTSIGAYGNLQITTQIVLGAMAGGIESMWIMPWAHALYDIGQTMKRFRSMYLSGEMVSGSVQTGAITATSVSATTVNSAGTANKVYGAVFN